LDGSHYRIYWIRFIFIACSPAQAVFQIETLKSRLLVSLLNKNIWRWKMDGYKIRKAQYPDRFLHSTPHFGKLSIIANNQTKGRQ